MATAKKSAPAPDEEGLGKRDTTLNLYQRIAAVMYDIRRLQKDKAVGSGSYAYKAVSEEKVVTEVRTAMLRHGLAIFPIAQHHTLHDYMRPSRNGETTLVSLSTVDVQYKLVNIDNPDESEIIASSGTGVDPQDKGVGKAMTYSMKYALLRTFMIPTGADPDDVHNEELARQQAPLPVGNGSGGSPTPSESPALPAASSSGSPVDSTGSGAAMQVSKGESDPLAASQPPVQYATASQKEQIIALLNHPVITGQEKTKMLLSIGRLDTERAEQAINKLSAAIRHREDSPTE